MTTDALPSTSSAPPVAWARAAGVLALLGGTLGVACDAAHVHSGTTRYLHPTVLGMAWWVVPLFAAAAVGLGLVPIALERTLGRDDAPPTRARAVGAMGLFVGAYVLSCAVHGVVGAVALLAIGATIAWRVDRRSLGVVAALGAAIVGPVVEATLVHEGLFVHTDVAFLAIPLWLPCLYVCASYAVSGLARSIALPAR